VLINSDQLNSGSSGQLLRTTSACSSGYQASSGAHNQPHTQAFSVALVLF